jgi:hypothetical protein
MASQYFVTIKLDPHYQQFLRSHFACDSAIFEFPAKHYFNGILEELLGLRREGHVEGAEDERTFKILLPNFARKNPAFFRYLSETRESVLKGEIKKYYDRAVTKKLHELLSHKEVSLTNKAQRMDRIKCTMLLIDEYGFNDGDKDSFDRLYKLYTRYTSNERVEEFRLKKHLEKLSVKKC